MMSAPTLTKDSRPVVSVQFETGRVNYARTGSEKRGRPSRFETLLHYRENINKTPTGGRYLSRRLTVRAVDGSRWVGQYKNGADTVILRPATDNG